jgi:hypothetical protein
MEESTFLEDFLQSVELLPNDIRRDFELMREHDKECSDGLAELDELEKNVLQDLKKRKLDTCLELPKIEFEEQYTNIYHRIQQRSSQKTSLAANMLKDLEKFIRKLDSDLYLFENELKGCGEYELLTRGIDPGSEVAYLSVISLYIFFCLKTHIPGCCESYIYKQL